MPDPTSGLGGMFPVYKGPDLSKLPDPVIPQVKVLPLPDSEITALGMPFDFHNRAQHEGRMNQWLMDQTQRSNANKIAFYLSAYHDWRTNAELYLSCRPPIQPPPPPNPPQLEDIGPKPEGYWFANNR